MKHIWGCSGLFQAGDNDKGFQIMNSVCSVIYVTKMT